MPQENMGWKDQLKQKLAKGLGLADADKNALRRQLAELDAALRALLTQREGGEAALRGHERELRRLEEVVLKEPSPAIRLVRGREKQVVKDRFNQCMDGVMRLFDREADIQEAMAVLGRLIDGEAVLSEGDWDQLEVRLKDLMDEENAAFAARDGVRRNRSGTDWAAQLQPAAGEPPAADSEPPRGERRRADPEV